MKKKPATIDSVRRALADAEALAGGLRAKLAKMEANERGEEAPICGLDLLWEAALPMSRQRSSKQLCRKAWSAIPSSSRPTVHEAIEALKQWNRCDQWRASDNIYAPGLHRYISARMWECPPEKTKSAPLHRNMSSRQPPTEPNRQPGVTDPDEIARLLCIKSKPAPVPKILAGMNGPEQITEMLSLIQAAGIEGTQATDL